MKPEVNNKYYDYLGDDWYQADNDPIAVLRVESRAKNPWVDKIIKSHFNCTEIEIADIGCGAGFLSNYLAERYSKVNGLDASKTTLEVAKRRDISKSVNYQLGDAYKLPYHDESQDVVCAMDFLEHVERPADVVKECSRVLKKGGIFFYHTFNRNFLSWLIVIKFMEWFMPNTPKNLHVLHLFIKPKELEQMMKINRLMNQTTVGIAPKFNLGFLLSILARKIRPDFEFKIGGPSLLGYMGYSIKQ